MAAVEFHLIEIGTTPLSVINHRGLRACVMSIQLEAAKVTLRRRLIHALEAPEDLYELTDALEVQMIQIITR